MPKGSSNPRYGKHYQRRANLRRRVAAEGRPCAICGKPIDYTLKTPHPMSYELDEIIPISKGGSPIEYANVQPTHRVCNRRKSNRVPPTSPCAVPESAKLPVSREW